MTRTQREEYANRIYDIIYLENLISYSQFLIGAWYMAEAVASDTALIELRNMLTIEDIESAIEIFGARYNTVREANN